MGRKVGRLLHVGLFVGAAAVTLLVLQASPGEERAEDRLSERFRQEIGRDPEFGRLLELVEDEARLRALESEARELRRVLADREAPTEESPVRRPPSPPPIPD